MIHAICELSVIPLRKEAADKSEMSSQIIFGETMEVLEENDKWFMVRLNHDHYEGWVDKKQVVQTKGDESSNIRYLHSAFEVATSEVKQRMIIPSGAVIYHADQDGFWLDDKRYLMENTLEKSAAGSDLIGYASQFLRTPYLWGGRTFMGIDCSGFTQLVMRSQGVMVLRDAYQQAELGDAISFVDESRTGDLAFFDNADGKITHVGMIVEAENHVKKIIHASGEVRLDSLDHQGIYHNEKMIYTHRLRLIKRIIQTP